MVLKSDTEKIILEAAREVFSEKGLAGARMQEIADRANINKAMLHYYFRSKEKLFDEIFKAAFAEFWPEVQYSLLASLDIEIFLERVLSSYIDLFMNKPYLPIFILSEVNRDPDRLEKLIKESGVNPIAIVNYLNKQMEQGILKKMNPKELLLNIISLSIFPFAGRPLISRMLFDGDDDDFKNVLQSRKQTLIDFLQPLIIKNKA